MNYFRGFAVLLVLLAALSGLAWISAKIFFETMAICQSGIGLRVKMLMLFFCGAVVVFDLVSAWAAKELIQLVCRTDFGIKKAV